MSTRRSRIGTVLRAAWRGLLGMPAPARIVLVAAAVALAFVAVVGPLFAGGGSPRAELSGFIPATVALGQQVRVDVSLDNVGDSIIQPVCIAMPGSSVRLLSAIFQGLDHVVATHNRVCGGQLTGQETISVTLVFVLTTPGSIEVRLVPQQGTVGIGPPFSTAVTVS